MKAALAVLAAFAPLLACSDDAPTDPIDAAVDVPIDVPIDGSGGCGADLLFTGEYVEWQSTNADFHGIFDATFTVVDSLPPRTATTAPNGRVILCIANGAAVRVTATEGGHTPAVFQVDPAVFTPPGSTFSSRGLTLAGRDADYGLLMSGMTFDAQRAHVLVEKRGTGVHFALGGAPAFAYNAETWASGDMGELVFFPNVPVGAGTATLTATGGTFVGPTSIELVAGQLTVVPLR